MRVKNRTEASGCCSCIAGGGCAGCCSLCLIITGIFLLVAGIILVFLTSDNLTSCYNGECQKAVVFDDTQKDLQR